MTMKLRSRDEGEDRREKMLCKMFCGQDGSYCQSLFADLAKSSQWHECKQTLAELVKRSYHAVSDRHYFSNFQSAESILI